ncbi:MAG: ammonium transporter [Planctomycetaceae bacterium]|nr:ammonium transporter [Planctomycetaceae bacterium]
MSLTSSSTAYAQEEPAAETETPAEEPPTEEAEEATEEEPDPATAPIEVKEPSADLGQFQYAFDNFVLFICAVLVFLMQAGFAMVESGFNSAKNSVNILFKNSMDVCVGVLLYWFIGYNLMYPGDWAVDKWLGVPAVGAPEVNNLKSGPGDLFPQADFLFQAVFAATAATIVSGAVAGRMKFVGYMVYSAVLTAFIYPISGSWKWGAGWLYDMGFYDFAGSIVVHAVGGFAGLAGAIVLGPRLGKYSADGKPQPMPGHSLPLAALGVFILWFGWYGFNPGSQLVFSNKANIDTTMIVAVNTTLSAAAGGVAATILSWILFSKPDLSMALNGILAGLVGITANCDGVSNPSAMIIGAVAGIIVVLAIIALDKLRIDDPVGAFPVHGACGVWGGIATGIFGTYAPDFYEHAQAANMKAQIIGSIVIPLYAFFAMLILFFILKGVGLLRVTPEEEEKGLDISEHGMSAYTH